MVRRPEATLALAGAKPKSSRGAAVCSPDGLGTRQRPSRLRRAELVADERWLATAEASNWGRTSSRDGRSPF